MRVYRVGPRCLCSGHVVEWLAMVWREYRYDCHLPERGRLPDAVREATIRWAERRR